MDECKLSAAAGFMDTEITLAVVLAIGVVHSAAWGGLKVVCSRLSSLLRSDAAGCPSLSRLVPQSVQDLRPSSQPHFSRMATGS
ncbi:hypothetical protein PAQ31011_00662 [Pandoraea aquatica]|uniref:Uncharacterized protein n=1 Tax=Pandoraea aquatica TaxID=2508290 RepID=A0A5E4SBD0_9BURK|nr:hypothetical protein PAQ31011_00662 [Pandoraea aquatica]